MRGGASPAAASPTSHEGFSDAGTGACRSPARGSAARLFADDLGRLTREHLVLVFGSLAAACLVGIPLGIAAAGSRTLAQPVLGDDGTGPDDPGARAARFPDSAHRGDRHGPGGDRAVPLFIAPDRARDPRSAHRHCEEHARIRVGARPAARPAIALRGTAAGGARILSGIKTSAVINVGTATIAAFIGAGGYGERITAGLALNDNAMLLAGAIPAACVGARGSTESSSSRSD